MEYKMFELGKQNACLARRNFPIVLEEADPQPLKRAIVINGTIEELLKRKGSMTDEEIKDRLATGFAEIDYDAPEQRMLLEKDAFKQIKRYVNSEKRKLVSCKAKTVSLNGKMDVVVAPSYYTVTEPLPPEREATLEVIKLKIGKPRVTKKAAGTDLCFFALLMYASTLAQELNAKRRATGMPEITTIIASYYYLAKDSDHYYGASKNFDTDFFSAQGKETNAKGYNIVQILDDVVPTSYMKTFDPIVDEFLAGLPKEECSENDCKKCQLNEICHFTEPPVAFAAKKAERKPGQLMLSEEQNQAVEFTDGICRINAVAGAGKTVVIGARTITLLEDGVDPRHIFLFTYTDAAANEMRRRIVGYMIDEFGYEEEFAKEQASKLVIMTFNAFGNKVIQEHYEELGFTEPPEVIEDVERAKIIVNLLNEAVEKPYYKDGVQEKNPLKTLDWRNFNYGNTGARNVATRAFEKIKAWGYNSMSDPEEVCKRLRSERVFSSDANALGCTEMFLEMYDEYDNILRDNNLIEYADQELMLRELMESNFTLVEDLHCEHLMVDEFQDSNENQVEMIMKFTEPKHFKSMVVVGDDSQSIYLFRNTSPEYMIHFDEWVKAKSDCECNDLFLETNYRSRPEILEFANKINANNQSRIEKEIKPHKESIGVPVRVKYFFDANEEARYVVKDIKKKISDGEKPENIAVIAFKKTELQRVASLLTQEGIPSMIQSPEPVLENSRVRAALALIRAIHSQDDNRDLLIFANAMDRTKDMLAMSAGELATAAEPVVKIIADIQQEFNPLEKKSLLMQALRSIDEGVLNEDGEYEGGDEIYQGFLKCLERKPWEKLADYVASFETYGEKQAVRRLRKYPGVLLTTAHSSKGLEWKIVYNILDSYDGKEMNANNSPHTPKAEDRRRLLFVSATRAEEELTVTGVISYGARGAYLYNEFMIESMEAVGQPFSKADIEADRAERAKRKKAEREAAKRQEAEKTAAISAAERAS